MSEFANAHIAYFTKTRFQEIPELSRQYMDIDNKLISQCIAACPERGSALAS